MVMQIRVQQQTVMEMRKASQWELLSAETSSTQVIETHRSTLT